MQRVWPLPEASLGRKNSLVCSVGKRAAQLSWAAVVLSARVISTTPWPAVNFLTGFCRMVTLGSDVIHYETAWDAVSRCVLRSPVVHLIILIQNKGKIISFLGIPFKGI